MRLISVLLLASASLCVAAHAQDLAVVDATVYVSPQAAPQTHTTVLMQRGKIVALGRDVRVPKHVRTLPCGRCVVFSGFWNSHVHFTGAQWTGAGSAPAGQLSDDMQGMLTHSGFTTVVDTSSDPENTVALRRRVEAWEVLGPHIYTAGFGLYPPHAIPFYLDDLPESLRARLPQPSTPAEATIAVQHNVALGSDAVKLFIGSYLSPDHLVHMSPEIARTAVAEGHTHGQLVFAHPSDAEGIGIAIASGVDVLAHAPSEVDGVDEAQLRELVEHHMAMIPTLKLFSGSRHIERIRQIVATFHGMGGVLLFGTDTGFLTDYDVAEEYRQLGLAGLSFREVLAMLTTAPAAEFKVASHAGTIKIGNDGDLTILASDPSVGELTDFSHVLYTIRAGRVIFDGKAP
jgi:imidazolonepropionase-like amidohydrolase